MTSQEHPELILLSGLAADASIFAPQKLEFPQLNVLSWKIPAKSDTLDSYAKRLADELANQDRLIIGGASFGGILALHMAQYVKPAAVILIGSLHAPEELPLFARAARPLRWFLPIVPMRLLQYCSAPLASGAARRMMPHLCRVVRQFRYSDPTVIKWSLFQLLDWKTAPSVECPVYHIHGKRDFVLPARYTSPDRLIEGGGHIISLSHAAEVNKFMREVIAEMRQQLKQEEAGILGQ